MQDLIILLKKQVRNLFDTVQKLTTVKINQFAEKDILDNEIVNQTRNEKIPSKP